MTTTSLTAGLEPVARDRRQAVTIVLAAIVIQTFSAPGQTVGISVFVDHFVSDLHLSRSAVAAAYLIGTAGGALSLPFAGRLIDRRGLRWATTAFAGAFGAVLVAMAGVTGFVTLAVGFAGTRMLGQGALTLTATTTVAVSFHRNRGTAMGIKSALGGALMALVPLVGAVLISTWGWRISFVIFGISVWVVLLPIARRVVVDARRHTELSLADTARRPPTVNPWPRAAVLRHPLFWLMTTGVALSALISTGLVFHQIDLLTARGLTAGEAAGNFVPQMAATAAAALGAGRLADRVAPRVLLPGAMALLAAAPLLLHAARPGLAAVTYALALGGAGGSIRTIEATLLPRWFGTALIGELRGIVLAVAVAASATGPLLVAAGGELFDGYGPVLVAMSVVAAVVGALSLTAREPAEPSLT